MSLYKVICTETTAYTKHLKVRGDMSKGDRKILSGCGSRKELERLLEAWCIPVLFPSEESKASISPVIELMHSRPILSTSGGGSTLVLTIGGLGLYQVLLVKGEIEGGLADITCRNTKNLYHGDNHETAMQIYKTAKLVVESI